VRAYDDLVFTANIQSERLREWYGLHFPELEVVSGGDAYAKAVAEHGDRKAVMTALKLEMDSIGSDIEPKDLETVQVLASSLKESYVSKSKIEKYVEERMMEVAPNISAIVGPVIGARLMMQAGSLKRLASMPSSTVQLLGAEKAMFRHLKKGTDPPKHGILFQHPLVHSAPVWQRGAIARALASKICLAARADLYSRNDISSLLREQLDKRVAEIRKQHAAAPKKPAGRSRKRRR
jgi:nucleolar protein 56